MHTYLSELYVYLIRLPPLTAELERMHVVGKSRPHFGTVVPRETAVESPA